MEDMGYTPAEISRMEIDRAADALNAQAAAEAAAPQPTSLDDARTAREQRTVVGRGDDVPDAA